MQYCLNILRFEISYYDFLKKICYSQSEKVRKYANEWLELFRRGSDP